MTIQELEKIQHLHHAYIVEGEGDAETLLRILENRGLKTVGNPDVLSLSFPDLFIDDVRDVILPFASLSPIKEKKYLIISFSRANDASQNALLKAVEESVGKTTFFFCVENAGHMLPTLRSRCITLKAQSSKLKAQNNEAEEFLEETYAKRLARVEKIVAYIAKTQDRGPARGFVDNLLAVAREKNIPAAPLRDILDATSYLRMQGSSAKAALSHLAVTLPRAKSR